MNLKVLSYNIHKGNGWKLLPTTMHFIQSKIQENFSDIVFLQEIRGTQSEQLKSDIYPHLVYGKNAIYRKGNHGNAILSKFPIIYSENIDISMHRFEHRGLLHAIVKMDEINRQVHLLCTHLGLFTKDREKQFEMIAKYINDNIPSTEAVLLGGDFNDWAGRATKPLIHDLEFQEAFLTVHDSYAKTFPSWIPILKLDRMYYRGFVVDDARRFTDKPWKHLSDHIAIEVSLSLVI